MGGYSNHLLSKFLPSPQAAKEGRAPATHSGSGAHKHLLGSCRGEAGRSKPSLLVPLGSGPHCWGRGELYTSLRQPRLGSLRSLSALLESAGAASKDDGIQDPEGPGGNWHFSPLSTQPKGPAPHPHRSKLCAQKKKPSKSSQVCGSCSEQGAAQDPASCYWRERAAGGSRVSVGRCATSRRRTGHSAETARGGLASDAVHAGLP